MKLLDAYGRRLRKHKRWRGWRVSGTLGAIHTAIGDGQQLFDVGAVLGEERLAYTQADAVGPGNFLAGSGGGLTELDDALGRFGAVRLGEDDDEFVASEA